MKTEYSSVRFCYPARVLPGRAKTEIDAHGSIKLVRVTDDDRDTLFVGGVGAQVEVPWSNVASATRAEPVMKPFPAKKGDA